MSIQDFYAEPHLDLADGFGSMLNRKTPHRGLDVNGWPIGTPVPALYNGTVARAEKQTGLGNLVSVRADAGFYEGSCHLSEIHVTVGQRVSAGDIIGLLGDTGTLCFGAHTHKTISPSSDDPGVGTVVDPLPYIRAARDGGTPPTTAGSVPADTSGSGSDYAFGLTTDAQKHAQDALQLLGYYSGRCDGVFGPLSVNAFQRWLKDNGFLGGDYTVDGVPGPRYGKAVQTLAAHYGYLGPIDGEPGAQTSVGIVAWGQSIIDAQVPVPTPVETAPAVTTPVPETTDTPATEQSATTPTEAEVTTPASSTEPELAKPVLLPVPTVDESVAQDAVSLASSMLPKRVRNAIYITYGLIGVVFVGTGSWLTGTQQLAPIWYVGMVQVYGAMGVYVALLAKANLK